MKPVLQNEFPGNKPSNVMVTPYADRPVVKVVHFGIAKAPRGKLTDQMLFTRFEQFSGTPVPPSRPGPGKDLDETGTLREVSKERRGASGFSPMVRSSQRRYRSSLRKHDHTTKRRRSFQHHFARLSRALALIAVMLPSLVVASIFPVNNVNDSGPGSLRQAILDALTVSPLTLAEIHFNIAGSGTKTIAPLSPLPTITGVTIQIDGRTQPGFAGRPLIEIDGTSAGAATQGFKIEGGALHLYSVIINRFGSDGIRAGGRLPDSNGNLLLFGCWIGVNKFGNLAAPNGGHGINLFNNGVYYLGSAGAEDRNVISGNAGDGIRMPPDLRAEVFIRNNYIGLGEDGATDCGNGGSGITAPPYFYYFDIEGYYIGATIGGVSAGTGNVISGNGGNGITIPATTPTDSQAIPIYRNLIGTDANGTQDVGNNGHGISIGSGNQCNIGSVGVPGNVISGNGLSGISMSPGPRLYLDGNHIGTNSVGAELGNGQHGIQVTGVEEITIRDCTIGNNGARGVSIEGASGRFDLHGNRIGTTAGGVDIGNGAEGVYVSAFDPIYGGTMKPGGKPALPGNKVAFNGGAGVRVLAATQIFHIAGNEIWGNVGLGIDLGGSGVTANDSGDGDSGPNALQNFPVITVATTTRVGGTLNSSAGCQYCIDLYTADPDPSGYGEGRTPLGSTTVTANGSGNASFLLTGLALTPGTRVTATAVSLSRVVPELGFPPSPVWTSEFSQILTVGAGDTGDFGLAAAGTIVSEDGGTVTLTVNRTGGSTGAAAVAYATSAGTASAGSDFPSQSGILSFASGQTSRTIVIPIQNDASDEPDETFTVTLSNPSGGPQITGTATATITIGDNDSPPLLAINDVAVNEGNAGTGTLTFRVSLTAASAFPVSVNWAATDQSANHTIDYLGGNGTLTFDPGESQKPLAFSIIGELTQELSETFLVTLAAPTNATLGDGSGLGTILDDDFPGAIQFAGSSHSVSEASETGLGIFVIRNGGAGTVTVSYSVTGGSGTADEDYSTFNMSGVLTFNNGETAKQVTVVPLDDVFMEGNETLVLGLSNPTGGAVLGAVSATTVTLVDDDFSPFLHGRAIMADGTPLPGVTVTISGNTNQSLATDAGGTYVFTGLTAGGSYTVTPSKPGYAFSPASLSFPGLSNTFLDQNFIASVAFIPTLYIVREGIGNVTLNWSNEALGWRLESSPTLEPGSWQAVRASPLVGDPWITLTLPVGPDARFFRLSLP